MHGRGPQATRLAPGRFRCLVCKAYVTGTASGHCPTCGFVPPAAIHTPPPQAFDTRIVGLVLIAIAVAIVVSLLL